MCCLYLTTRRRNTSVFEISVYFLPSDSHILGVRNARLGAASLFSNNGSDNSTIPTNNVVLMRGHGLAVIGPDIAAAVFRSIKTRNAANTQRESLIVAALGGS
jgi:ribulose-5-phosphate 4-epimerase/fuculose-1-phosphate aldolase